MQYETPSAAAHLAHAIDDAFSRHEDLAPDPDFGSYGLQTRRGDEYGRRPPRRGLMLLSAEIAETEKLSAYLAERVAQLQASERSAVRP